MSDEIDEAFAAANDAIEETRQKLLAGLEEMIVFINRNAEQIYVREQIDGKWGAYSLAELPPEQSRTHAMRLLGRYMVYGAGPTVVGEPS